jgi:hypothetical protein
VSFWSIFPRNVSLASTGHAVRIIFLVEDIFRCRLKKKKKKKKKSNTKLPNLVFERLVVVGCGWLWLVVVVVG